MDVRRDGWWRGVCVLALMAAWPAAASGQYRMGNLFSPPTYDERTWNMERRGTARTPQYVEEVESRPTSRSRPTTGRVNSQASSPEATPRRISRTSSQTGKPGEKRSEPVPAGPGAPHHEEMIVEGEGYHGGDGCGSCGQCWDCRPRHRWIRLEYLHWQTKGMDTPPLVTTAPVNGTGAIGDAGTVIAFGDTDINDDSRSGGRITYGWDWNPCDEWSAEIGFMVLDTEETDFSLNSPAGVRLARPFFNMAPAAGAARQDANIISDPGNLAGFVSINAQTDFQAANALLRRNIVTEQCMTFDVLMGYRFSKLEDDISFSQSQTVLTAAGGLAIGTNISLNEQFSTRNEFHGADLGFQARYRRCRWTLDLLMKVGVGTTNSETFITGQTTRFVPNAGTATSAGGLLTQPSNIGTFTEDHFSVVPEFGLSVRYDITPCLRATAGYSFVYWSHVARAGDQIDFDVNLSQQPPGPFVGAARPEFAFGYTDFWAQGLHAGLELQF